MAATDQVLERIDQSCSDLGEEMRVMRSDLGDDMRSIRSDLAGEMQVMRSDLTAELRAMYRRLTQIGLGLAGVVAAGLITLVASRL